MNPIPTAHPFHVLANPVGSLCNLDCKYCYYLEKERLYPKLQSRTMSLDVLERFIAEYIQAQPNDEVNFLWQGGEPTLAGLDYFQQIVTLQRKHAAGKKISNALQTNATLLDERFCEFLAKERFLLGVSVDGPERFHDSLRRSKGDSPTLSDTLRGLTLIKQFQIEFNLLCVVHRDNALHPLEVYEYLKSIGGRYLQFIPLVERQETQVSDEGLQLVLPTFQGKSQMMPWSVRPTDYGQFLISIFDYWFREDVGKVFVQLFDVTLENWLGLEPALCLFRTTCGNALAIEKNGDIYSCDHFVFPENHLGNINEVPLQSLVLSEVQRNFGNAKQSSLPRQCRDCDVYFACKGECPKNRFDFTQDGESGLNYLCQAYLAFFRHVRPAMNQMAAAVSVQR